MAYGETCVISHPSAPQPPRAQDLHRAHPAANLGSRAAAGGTAGSTEDRVIFLVAADYGAEVFLPDRVQQVSSRSLIFPVEVFKVLALDRVCQRLRLFTLQLVRMRTRISLVKGFFALFNVLKNAKLASHSGPRVPASGSPSTPAAQLEVAPLPDSMCSSGNASLARLTSGTDELEVQSGRLQLVSMSCGAAKGMRREGSGTGTETRVSPRLSSLLFLLGEEQYRQPRAVYKYWAGGLRSCDHAATTSSSSSSSICFLSSTKCWTFLLCFRDRYPQCYCAGTRCASFTGYGHSLCSCSTLRTWRCLRFRPRQSTTDSSCTPESCTYSANCASTGDSTAQFLVRLFTRPLFGDDRCLCWSRQCRKS